ncbi:YcgN family cysteine cluster protein [Beijerinckia sp. L45]|uniref:YcgN family cysteine cluster protein n=1 Tax=Beijerinckia sp. L45 TaxID=1641855 RepID=UPI001FED8DDF|nr:YcgN family cysteine cluster protein [Beijerinckia sp. L45]
MPDDRPFWQTKTLEAMTPTEWESLCDRCGKCCLVKLEDEDTGQIFLTDIGCKLFDAGACACSNYPARRKKVRDCIKLTPMSVRAIGWLPRTCGYRLVAEGRPLEAWHPLISGSSDTVHEAGISVRGRTNGSEKTVKLEDYPLHIVDWEDGTPEPM